MENHIASAGSSPSPLDQLRASTSWHTLAAVLGIDERTLRFFAHARSGSQYKSFEIRKRRGGTRRIDAPKRKLAELQRRIAKIFSEAYPAPTYVHGFCPGRSIATNAERHVGMRVVLNIDLEDFFPTIHFGRVMGRLRKKPYNLTEWQARVIAGLCCYKRALPQGAPSSPIMSNIVCGGMDKQLRVFAREKKCRYSRYADDMTFSTRKPAFDTGVAWFDPKDAVRSVRVGAELRAIIETNGFRINESKVRVMRYHERQEVAGLITNTKANVRRGYVRELRAILHAVRKHGWDSAAAEHFAKYRVDGRSPREPVEALKRVIWGRLEFVRFIKKSNDQVYINLADQFRELVPTFRQEDRLFSGAAIVTRKDVFLCHASEDKKRVVRPLHDALEAANISSWLDEAQIAWGDSLVTRINEGLREAKVIVVVLSRNFLAKEWPKAELRAALSGSLAGDGGRVLPLMVGSPEDEAAILKEWPLLQDLRYEGWRKGQAHVVGALRTVLERLASKAVVANAGAATQTTNADDGAAALSKLPADSLRDESDAKTSTRTSKAIAPRVKKPKTKATKKTNAVKKAVSRKKTRRAANSPRT